MGGASRRKKRRKFTEKLSKVLKFCRKALKIYRKSAEKLEKVFKIYRKSAEKIVLKLFFRRFAPKIQKTKCLKKIRRFAAKLQKKKSLIFSRFARKVLNYSKIVLKKNTGSWCFRECKFRNALLLFVKRFRLWQPRSRRSWCFHECRNALLPFVKFI